MANSIRPNPGESGFIRGRLFVTLLSLILALAVLHYGSLWGKEFYKVKMGETCSERMQLIEAAKAKYRKRYGGGVIQHYGDLLPFLPYTGFPMCPWGGEYSNTLNVGTPVTCSLNGQPDYEPMTPGLNPMANGYQDLAPKMPLNPWTILQHVVSPPGAAAAAKKKAEVKLFRD